MIVQQPGKTAVQSAARTRDQWITDSRSSTEDLTEAFV
jgi:hypothetical protein